MVIEVKIAYDKCTSCKKCLEACIFGVLEWFEDRPIVANPNNCSVCLECKSTCPVDAVTVKER